MQDEDVIAGLGDREDRSEREQQRGYETPYGTPVRSPVWDGEYLDNLCGPTLCAPEGEGVYEDGAVVVAYGEAELSDLESVLEELL